MEYDKIDTEYRALMRMVGIYKEWPTTVKTEILSHISKLECGWILKMKLKHQVKSILKNYLTTFKDVDAAADTAQKLVADFKVGDAELTFTLYYLKECTGMLAKYTAAYQLEMRTLAIALRKLNVKDIEEKANV